ncbi:unnamed protein product, partial [Iphiclides podalirius]
MRIGWSYVHVESLKPRPMKCFRCLEIGHTRLQCTSEVDRSDICYRCSAPGHKAAACLAKPHWAVCAVAGDATGTAAIYVPDGTTPLSVKERGNGFVAADWGKYTIFSVYFSPNKTLAELETLLGDMQAAIR